MPPVKDTTTAFRQGAQAIDLGEAIDAHDWGGFQKLILLMIGCAIMFDGFDNQSLGLAAPAIIRDWGISKQALAPILALGQVGMMLGTVLGGALGDRIGRKTALVGSVLVFAMATLLMAAAPSVWVLGMLRIVAGCGLGGALPNAAALVSEYTPARHRSLAVTAGIVCVPLGGVVGGLIAAQLLSHATWRALFALAGGIPLIVAGVLAMALPESTRFIFRREGDTPRLRRILARIGVVLDADTPLIDRDDAASPRARSGPGALFTPALARDTAGLWAAFGFCLVAIYAGFNWLPTMLTESGFSLALSSMGLMAFNLGGVLAALLGAWQIGARGSRGPMVAMALGGVLAAAGLLLVPISPATPTWAMIAALGVLGGCVNGVQTTLYALGAHIYPVTIRATGVGTASGVGRIGAISSAFLGALALSLMGPAGFYALMVLAMLVTALALMAIRRHAPPHA
jgi:AAHS family 4-hydroxybenzoate transporter-like MFS transporter